MRVYVLTTGILFGLIVLAHIARLFAEGAHLVQDPIFITLTLAALAVAVWATVLLTRRS
jgi:hypothetical protein